MMDPDPAKAAGATVPGEQASICGAADVCWENACCAVCGSCRQQPAVRAANFLYGRPGSVQIVRCRDCGHYYVSPRPTRQTIGQYYPSDYGPHVDRPPQGVTQPAGGDSPQPWHLSTPMRAMPGLRRLYYWLSNDDSEILPEWPGPGARALEIGCGSGRYLQKLQQAGWEAEGIEPAAAPSARSRQRGLAVRTGGLEDFQLADDHYDAVVSWMVLEHLHDPAAALRKIHRTLKPTGALLLSVPNFGCWERRVFGRYNMVINEPTHLQHFTPRSLRRLLNDNGFQVQRIRHQQNLYNVIGSLGILMQSRFPSKRAGRRLMDWIDDPSLRGRLALSPLAKVLAMVHQGGRLTVSARPKKMTRRLLF